MTVYRLRRLEPPIRRRLPPTDLAPPTPRDAVVVDAGDSVVDDDTDETVLAVGRLPSEAVFELRRALLDPAAGYETLRNTNTWLGRGRGNGMVYSSRTFGYAPREVFRKKEGCSSAALAAEAPAIAAAIHRITSAVEAELGRAAPDAHARQRALAGQVHEDWRIAGSSWTSGIINNSAALPYHVDRNNLPGSWSGMLCLRAGYRGGLLHVPGYGVHVACSDGSLVFFCGADLRHGVTPLERRPVTSSRPYRFTLVWYAQSLMRHCLPCAAELALAQRRRTLREGAPAPTT